MATKRRKLVEPEAEENAEDKPDFRYRVLSTGQIYSVKKSNGEMWTRWENYMDSPNYLPGAPQPSAFRVTQEALDRSISFSSIEILSN